MASVTELRLLPIREVTRKIGCSRPHVYRLIHTANFPRPVHLMSLSGLFRLLRKIGYKKM